MQRVLLREPPRPDSVRSSPHAHWFVVGAVCTGAFMGQLDASIVTVALPHIGQSLQASAATVQWVALSYMLVLLATLMFAGQLADRLGRKLLYTYGFAVFTMGSLLCGLSASLPLLIGARVLQGLGAAMLQANSVALIREAMPSPLLNRGMGIQGAAQATGLAMGPAVGGLLIALGGWRVTLAVNIPLALACLVIGWRRLPGAAGPRTGSVELDAPGILLFAAMLTALLLFLMESHPLLLAVALLAGAGLAVRELRMQEPFLDLRLLGGNRPLLATYARTLLAMTVSYAFLYGYTQWLEDTRGLTASQAGLILLPMPLIAIGVSALSGRRREVRGKLILGAGGQLVACALLLALGAGSAIWLCVAITMVLGVPQGLNSLANQNALYYQADPARIGSSAGLLRTFGYLGAISASAAVGGFFGDRAGTDGLHELAIFLLATAGLFLALTLMDRSLRTLIRRSA